MYIRCAFFEGRVKPGCDDAFASFVKNRLVPLWTKFPGAAEVRVLRQPDLRHARAAFCHGALHQIPQPCRN